MTAPQTRLVPLGPARRQTQANQEIGVLEGNPVNKFRTGM